MGTNTAGLRPFTTDTAAAAGRASVEARRARKAIAATETSALRAELDRVRDTFQRDELGEAAAAVAGQLLARVAAGAIVVKGPDVAALLRVLVDIARLEAGEHTSAALVGHVSTSDALARVATLREEARAALGSAAVVVASAAAVAVADDPAGVGAVGAVRVVGDSIPPL